MKFVLEATLSTPISPPKHITFRRSSPTPHPAVRYVVASVMVALKTPIFWVTPKFPALVRLTKNNVRLALGRYPVRISVRHTGFTTGAQIFQKSKSYLKILGVVRG